MLNTVISLLIVIVVIGSIAILIYRKIQDDKLLSTVTDKRRGTRTERKLVLKMLKSNFNSKVVFHDLYIKKQNKGYSQIDMVVPTKVGIFVFEVKSYAGWIFGDCNQYKWTQILAYGREKYRFYNPVKQNHGHILALRSRMHDIGDVPYYSIIVFYGRCTLKSIKNVPPNTVICYAEGVNSVIQEILATEPIAPYVDKHKVVDELRKGVSNGANPLIVSEHLESLRY